MSTYLGEKGSWLDRLPVAGRDDLEDVVSCSKDFCKI
jgi:hypothetical protein